MKKLFTYLLLSTSIVFVGCIDSEFDLGNVNNDNVGIGDSESEITLPVTSINLNLDDILVDFTRATQTYTLDSQTVEDTFSLGQGWMDEELKSQLVSEDGDVKINIEFTPYPEGLPEATIDLWFGDISLFDEAQVVNSNNTVVTTSSLSVDEIDEIYNTETLSYKVYFSEQTFSCDFEDLDCITLNVTLTRTGAITF